MKCHVWVVALVQQVDLGEQVVPLQSEHIVGIDELRVAVGDVLLMPCQGHRFDHEPRVVGAL